MRSFLSSGTLFSIWISLNSLLAQDTSRVAYKYILDYSVPQSPAFVALGVTPSKVLSGSSAKPLAINIINQLREQQKINNGVALDFSPYFTFGGQFKSIDTYRNKWFMRVLANTLLSVATIEDSDDSESLRFGVGFRTTIIDVRDLLSDHELGKDIDAELQKIASPSESLDAVDEVSTKKVDLTQAYETSRKRLEAKKGGALSFGYGLAGILNGSIANKDSVENAIHKVWLSYTSYNLFDGIDLLVHYQGEFSKTLPNSDRLGFALRGNTENTRIAFEAVVGFLKANSAEIGGVGEVKLAPNIWLVVSLGTSRPPDGEKGPHKVFARTKLRWNIGN